MKPLPPFWYALAGLITCPIYGLVFVVGGVILILLTPFAPFILYVARKDEISLGDCDESA